MKTNDDLKRLATAADSYFTVAIPAPSNRTDAEHRFELEWRNARRELSARWDDAELAQVDEVLGGLTHAGGEALVLVHPRGGPTHAEFLDEPIAAGFVHEGPVPRLATLIEARRRAIAHVVVETDRAGADLTAFDGGDVVATQTVDGETVHIHRGHPGGWSQRRFQQHAENTWENNARDVSEAVAHLARPRGGTPRRGRRRRPRPDVRPGVAALRRGRHRGQDRGRVARGDRCGGGAAARRHRRDGGHRRRRARPQRTVPRHVRRRARGRAGGARATAGWRPCSCTTTGPTIRC